MENGAGCSNQSDDQGSTTETTSDQENRPFIDSLCHRATQVKEKYQDGTYTWVMVTLDVIFEYFQGEERAKILADLTKVMKSLCLQDIEHKQSIELFDKFCKMHPLQKASPDFNYTSEFNKYLAKKGKVKEEIALKHPKYLKFMESVKKKERGKEISETPPISVD